MPNHTEKNSKAFYFESYGVQVRVECEDHEIFEDARDRAREALAGNFRLVDPVETPHSYRLSREDRTYLLQKDDRAFRHGESKELFLKYFDSAVRITVAEYAVDRLFLHAGVVGWKGRAILIPGTSFSGKTSLVHEFVRRGAEYYSDEYAVFDEEGLVHPFARKIAMRSRPGGNEVIEMTYMTPEELGGTTAVGPVPVGFILLTQFHEGSQWQPEKVTHGKGVFEMLSHTIPIRYKPEFSLQVLKKVTANAIILKSFRPDAAEFSEMFLEIVDNKVF